MESSSATKPTEYERMRARDMMVQETTPYYKMLAHVQSLKMPRAIINIGTSEVKFDYGEDLPVEKQIKERIENIEKKYLPIIIVT